MPNEEAILQKLNEELKRRQVQERLRYFEPHQPPNNDQLGFYMSTATTELVVGGVRAGKTEIAIKKCHDLCTGTHPTLSQRLKVPVTIWILAPAWEDNVKGVIVNRLREMIPRSDLLHQDFDRAWSEKSRTLKYANGSMMRFFSHEQDISVFAGNKIHAFWSDEHTPLSIYNELVARTIDYNGIGMLTMAPDKGGGLTWEIDKIVDKFGKDPEIGVWYFSTYDNPTISHEGITKLEKLLENDPLREAKLYGRMVGLAGMVYPTYAPNVHYKEFPELPPHWTRIFVINPHLRIDSVWMVLAINPDDEIIVELEGNSAPTAGGIADLKMAIRRSLTHLPRNARIALWLGDEAMGGKGLNVFGEESVLEQLASHPDPIPVEPTSQQSDKAFEAGVMRVRELLSPDPLTGRPRLYVSHDCPNTHREFMRWQFRERTRTDDQLLREKTQTVNKEYLDCVRYGVMARNVFTVSQRNFAGIETYAS